MIFWIDTRRADLVHVLLNSGVMNPPGVDVATTSHPCSGGIDARRMQADGFFKAETRTRSSTPSTRRPSRSTSRSTVASGVRASACTRSSPGTASSLPQSLGRRQPRRPRLEHRRPRDHPRRGHLLPAVSLPDASKSRSRRALRQIE